MNKNNDLYTPKCAKKGYFACIGDYGLRKSLIIR